MAATRKSLKAGMKLIERNDNVLHCMRLLVKPAYDYRYGKVQFLVRVINDDLHLLDDFSGVQHVRKDMLDVI